MRKIFLILFLFFPLFVLSQCDKFSVFQIKGIVTYTDNGKKLNLNKNDLISKTGKLFVNSNSSIVLLCGNDKALTLSQSGFYSYEYLKSACIKNKTTLTREYFKYVAQKIVDKEDPKTVMVIKGAVYRTKGVFEQVAMIQPKDSAIISSDSLKFIWQKPKNINALYFILYENGLKKILNISCKDTCLTINSNILMQNKMYFWLVSTNENPTNNEVRYHFIFDDKNWKENYLINMESIKEELLNKGEKMKEKNIQDQEQKKEEYLKENKLQ